MIPAAFDPGLPDLPLRVGLAGLVLVSTVLLMEGWALRAHERVWHHALWFLHRSHHRPRTGPFEANDLLALVNAPPAVLLLSWGTWGNPGWVATLAWAVGAGISLYGTAYLVVHDGYVHGRLPLAFLDRSAWLRKVRAAHRVHHADEAAPFGLFMGPWELEARRAALRRRGQEA